MLQNKYNFVVLIVDMWLKVPNSMEQSPSWEAKTS
jgi:hypothetical protein